MDADDNTTEAATEEPVAKTKVTKKKAAKKKVSKRKSAKRSDEAAPASAKLPTKALILTDSEGNVAGVLPRDALVMVKRGIVAPHGPPIGVDPRPTQRAFLWLLGRQRGEGLDPAVPHQSQALRLVEYLVRASVMERPGDRETIAQLYRQFRQGMPPPRQSEPGEPAPLSAADLQIAIGGRREDDDE